MKTQEITFEKWFMDYKTMLVEKYQWLQRSVDGLDSEAYKKTYFNNGLTVDEAYQEDLYYSN